MVRHWGLPDRTILDFETKLWYYLYRSAILCPNHIPPFHQRSLQAVQSCLPEPDVPTHVHRDHASRTESSYEHIRLWHLGQPAGVRRHRHWSANRKYVETQSLGRNDQKDIKTFTQYNISTSLKMCKLCCQKVTRARVSPGSTWWPWLCVFEFWCLLW